jgi:hypothetical protein
MIPLTIPETARLLATTWHQPKPPEHDTHWRNWRWQSPETVETLILRFFDLGGF